jgi:hypothetical protein
MFSQSAICVAAIVFSLGTVGTAAAGGGAHGGVTVTKGTTAGFNGNVRDHRGDTLNHDPYGRPNGRPGPKNGGWKPNGPTAGVRDHR